ncbi:MAG TPA: type VI secretion system baseplate subunit TssE [Acidobacteriaceae bacterium]|nr:type VI secretion system baseplate subunit TssE [Acidobacteriaceae bacterium]
MARLKSDTPITQSLMDRLIDHDEMPSTRSQSVVMFRNSIKRDVEWLLNSRKAFVPEIENYPLAANSVFTFGLPDVNELPGGNSASNVLAAISQTIQIHEPRIREPRVSLVRTDTLARSLRFHVEGKLVLENSEEDISFDTLFEVTSGEYQVK